MVAPTFGPYSPVRKAGGYYFVSGQVGVDPATKTAASDVTEQTDQALTNLRHLLEQHGLGPDQVVKTTIFLKDMADFAAVNEVYTSFFAEPRPARSCVAVVALPDVADKTLLVEIEAVAYRPRSAGNHQA